MLNKTINSAQASKNASFYKKKAFPSLSHKPSESLPRERLLELGYMPHWNDTLSVTDCSSAGRFFQHVEGSNTCRAASNSLRMPRVSKPRDTFISKQSSYFFGF